MRPLWHRDFGHLEGSWFFLPVLNNPHNRRIVNSTPAAACAYNVTIASNQGNAKASEFAYRRRVYNANGTIDFQKGIIANNTNLLVVNGRPLFNPKGYSRTLTSMGHSIVSETADCNIVDSFTLTSPLLGTLHNNGGPTLTHALLKGSRAMARTISPRRSQATSMAFRGLPMAQVFSLSMVSELG